MAAILSKEQQKASQQFGSFESLLFQDRNKYHTVRPGTKGPTTVRIYPQFYVDGTTAPMVIGERQLDLDDGTVDTVLDLSNLVQVDTISSQGLAKENYFTGVTAPSDRPSTRFDRVFGGTYIKAKAKKRNPFDDAPQALKDLVTKLTANREGSFNKPMSSPEETYFVRCAVLLDNGTKLPKPAMNGVLVLRGTAVTAYLAAITRAHKDGIDLFNLDTGFNLTFGALPPDKAEGRNTAISTCVRGNLPYNGAPANKEDLEAKAKPQKLPAEVVRKCWSNVEDDFKKLTWKELMAAAIKCYTAEVVARAFPEQYNEYVSGAPTAKQEQKQETIAEDAFSAEEPKEEVKPPKEETKPPKEEVKSTPKTETKAEDDMDAAYEAMLEGMK